MKRIFAAAALIALSACATNPLSVLNGNTRSAPAAAPAPAVVRPPQRTARQRLVTAIEARGCVLNAENAGAIKVEAVLSDEDLKQLTLQLAADGQAEVSGSGTIRILSDNCI